MRKETVKLSLFADNMIFYIKHPQDNTKQLLELMSAFGKITEYKVKIL